MGDLGDLPEADGGRRRIVVALPDDLYELFGAASFVAEDCIIVYVLASSLSDPNREADLWIGSYTPSAVGRSLFFQTLSKATYEIDQERFVWRNGDLVAASPLADYGVPESGERGILRIGSDAGLLFMFGADDFHLRIRVTTPLLLTARSLPSLPRGLRVPRGWLSIARRLRHSGDEREPS